MAVFGGVDKVLRRSRIFISIVVTLAVLLGGMAEGFAVGITVNSPTNDTAIPDNTPALNFTTTGTANVTYNWNDEGNISGCRDCTSFNTTYGENNGSDANITALWHFNENLGTDVYDDSSNNNNGTLVNGATFNTGKFGHGVKLDGADGGINVSYDASLDIIDNNDPFAVAVWIKMTKLASDTGVDNTILSQQSGAGTGAVWFQVESSDNTLKSALGGTVLKSNLSIDSTDKWYLIALTYNGTHLDMYINGTYDVTKIGTVDQGATGDYNIGRTKGESKWFNGTIDELMFFDRNLSAAEIQELYSRALPDGQHNATVYANDGALNSTTQSFTVDTTDPTFSTYQRNPNPPNEDQGVQLNVTLTEANADTVILEFDNGTKTNYTVTTSAANKYYFTIAAGNYTAHDSINYSWWANDTAGNVNWSAVQSFTVENQAPTTPSLTAPTNTSYSSATVTISWSASTDNDAEDTVTYWVFADGTVNKSVSGNTTTIDFADGFHNVQVLATDTYANTSLSTDVNFTVDTTIPTFSTYQRNPDPPHEDQSVQLNVTLTEANADTVILEFDNGTKTNYTVTASVGNKYYFTITAGNYTAHDSINYRWWANDTAGNVNWSAVQNFTVANQAPTTPSLTAPTNMSYSSATVTIDWTASTDDDAEDAVTYWVFADGAVNKSVAGNSTTIDFADGPHNVQVLATDTYANTSSTVIYFTVDTTIPTVTSISPSNNTVDGDGAVTFTYNVTDASQVDNCTLVLNGASNQTDTSITKDTTQNFSLNLGSGGHNWSVSCSDSDGNSGSSETRAVAVIFSDEFGGDSTDLSSVPDISNISNFVLENPSYGKINFSGNVDLSSGADLDTHVNISKNRIEINSTALPALNTSATLYLYGLSLSNPRILRDGGVCPSSICTIVAYSGGNLTFNVTHFTTFSADETPTSSPPSGGGGGGCSHRLSVKDYQISGAVVGGKAVLSLTIENTGCNERDITVWASSLPVGWSADNKTIDIPAGAIIVNLTLEIPASEDPGRKSITIELTPKYFTASFTEELWVGVKAAAAEELPPVTTTTTVLPPTTTTVLPTTTTTTTVPPQTTAPPIQEGAPPVGKIAVVLVAIGIIVAGVYFYRYHKRKKVE